MRSDCCSTHLQFLHTSPILKKRILSLLFIKTGISCFFLLFIFLGAGSHSFFVLYKTDLRIIIGIVISIALHSLIASAIALNLALNLSPRIGKLLTLIVFGILASLCSVLAIIALAINYMFPRVLMGCLTPQWQTSWVPCDLLSSHLLDKESWFVLPFRTILFEPISVLLLLAVTGILFFLTVETQNHKFNVFSHLLESPFKSRKIQLNLFRKLQSSHRFSKHFTNSIVINEWRYLFRKLPLSCPASILPFAILTPFTVGGNTHSALLLQNVSLALGPLVFLVFFTETERENPDLYKASAIFGNNGKRLYQLKCIVALTASCVNLFPVLLLQIIIHENRILSLILFFTAMIYVTLIAYFQMSYESMLNHRYSSTTISDFISSDQELICLSRVETFFLKIRFAASTAFSLFISWSLMFFVIFSWPYLAATLITGNNLMAGVVALGLAWIMALRIQKNDQLRKIIAKTI